MRTGTEHETASVELTHREWSSAIVKSVAIICGACLVFGFFVWPGQWHYSQIGDVPMRTHRLSGRSELFAGGNWIDVSQSTARAGAEDSTATLRFHPMFIDIQGRGGVDATGYFDASIYNGTPCQLQRVVVKIVTLARGDTLRRSYSTATNVASRQSGTLMLRADGVDRERRFLSWSIDSVEVRCPKGTSAEKNPFADILNRPPAP